MNNLDPYLSYAKVEEVGTIDFSLASPETLLSNFKNYPEDTPIPPKKPSVGYFGGNYFIHASDLKDFIAGCIYLQSIPPTEKLELITYESRDVAASRMQAVYGNSRLLEVVELPVPDLEESLAIDEESKIILEAKSEIQLLLANFIKSYGDQQPRKAYGLYGHSGVSKSALVRNVVEEVDADAVAAGEWGYRVASLKIGFLDKNDTQGFAIPLKQGGVNVWTDSPAEQLITNSDDFVNSCREFLTENPSLKEEDPEAFAKFSYYAKTPVIFLDELNRADKSIMNAMLGFINSGKLGNRLYKTAVKIVAINDNSEQLEGIQYLVTEMDDIASSARMKWLPVSGDNTAVVRSALDYLKSIASSEVSQAALDMAFNYETPSGKRLLYDPDLVDMYGKFPTFRGWEDTIKYLNKIDIVLEKYGNLQKQVFNGTLGINASNILVEWLQQNGVEIEEKSAGGEIEVQLNHGMEAGIPIGLFGKSGVAKSATIAQVVESRDTIPYEVTLSTEEKTSIGGYPRPDNFARRTFMNVDESLIEKYEEVARRNNVAQYATYFDPHIEVLQVVESARKNKKPLTLIFDEVNRCSPVVQSAVFEAISEKRFKGVDLTGVDVNVVIAGNWSETGEFSGAKDIDTATLHRTASLFIEEVSDPMIESFLKYLKKRKPVAYDVLKPIIDENPEWLKTMLNSESDLMTMGTMVENKLFTMREIDMIEEEIINAGKPVFAYLDPTITYSREALMGILANENYVLNKNDFYINIPSMYKEYTEPLGISSDTTTQEFAQKLLQAIADDDTNMTGVSILLTAVEEDIFKKLFVSIEDTLSPKALEYIEPAIKDYITQHSIATLHIDSAEDDVFSEDEEEQFRAMQRFFEKNKTKENRNFKNLLDAFLSTSLEEREESVGISRIISAVNIYNDSTLGVNNPMSGLFIHRILENYPHKIQNELTYPLEIVYDAYSASTFLEGAVMDAINQVRNPLARELFFAGFFGNTETAISTIEEDLAGLLILDPMTAEGRKDFLEKIESIGKKDLEVEKVTVGVSTTGIRKFVNYRNILFHTRGGSVDYAVDGATDAFLAELGEEDFSFEADEEDGSGLQVHQYLFKDAWVIKEADAEDNLCNISYYLETPLGSITIRFKNISLLSKDSKPITPVENQLALSAEKIPSIDLSMLSGYSLLQTLTGGEDVDLDIDNKEIAKLSNVDVAQEREAVNMQSIYSQIFRRYLVNGVNKIFRGIK